MRVGQTIELLDVLLIYLNVCANAQTYPPLIPCFSVRSLCYAVFRILIASLRV